MKQSKKCAKAPQLPPNSPTPAPVVRRNTLAVWDGKKYVSLGRADDSASYTRYAQFLIKWKETTPDSPAGGVNSENGTLNRPRRETEKSTPVPHKTTIADLSLAFLDDAVERRSSHYYKYRTVCKFLKPYSRMSTAEFDAYTLLQLQQEFDRYGYARKYVNNMVGFVRQIFKWGETRRLVPAGKYEHLKTLEPLREGRETEEREEAEWWVVERTLPYLLPVYRVIILILAMTGARPKELFRMKVEDIEREMVEDNGKSGEIWCYCPRKHKTSKKNKRRVISFGAKEQAILTPYIAGKEPGDFVFSPHDAVLERKQRDREARKTKVQPSQVERERLRKENPKRKTNPMFNTDVVGNALRDTIARANKTLPADEQIPAWTLYQLRYAYISDYVEKNGVEAAALMVGHSDNAMIRKIYDKSQKRRILKQKLRDEGGIK